MIARVVDRVRWGRFVRTLARLSLRRTAIAAAGTLWLLTARALADGVECNQCHGNVEFLVGKGASPDRDAALFVPDSTLHGTKHAGLACADCHHAYDGWPHSRPERLTVECESCHEAAGVDWAASSHAAGVAASGKGPRCTTCHGIHRVLGSEDRESPIHPLNEARLCASCHGEAEFVAAYFSDPADSVARSAVERYHETVHGLALERDGLVVSATCSDCHHAHRILPSDSTMSTIHRTHVAETCGTCHVGVLEQFQASAHGTALAAESGASDPQAPSCTTCHSAHGVVEVTEAWRVDVVEECQQCHEAAYATYFETQHGKITRLGGLAAKCSDCHTPHSNLPAENPASSVHRTNLVETCGQCHENASSRFVWYQPHPDVHDRQRFPVLFWTQSAMSGLILGVFGFFGTHSVLWLLRALWERRRGGVRVSPEPPPAPDGADPLQAPSSESRELEKRDPS